MSGQAALGRELVPPGSLALERPVYGIDPSTLRVAVAAVLPADQEPRLRFDILSLPRVEGAARFGPAYVELAGWFMALVKRWPAPSHVFVEQPFAKGRHVHPSSQQMVGVVLAAVGNAIPGVRLRLLGPPTWKKNAIGNGRADKDQIMEWARAQGYGRDFPDEADALGVATAGGVLLGG